MVGEAKPKSAKAGADESSAFDAPPLKNFKILFFAGRESLGHFLSVHASASLPPPGHREGRTPSLVGFASCLTQRLLFELLT